MENETLGDTLCVELLVLAASARHPRQKHLADVLVMAANEILALQREMEAVGRVYIKKVASDSGSHRVQFGDGTCGVYADYKTAAAAFIDATGLYSKKNEK